MTEVELIEQAEAAGLDKWQMIQVRLALKIVPVEQILTFAKPDYTHRQMEQIRIAYMDGIDVDMAIYTPEVPPEQMAQMRLSQLQLHNNGKFDEVLQQLAALQEQVDCIRQESAHALCDIKESLQSQSARASKPEAKQAVHGEHFRRRKKTVIEKIVKQNYNAEQLEEIRQAVEHRLTEQQMNHIAVPSMPAERMKQLRLLYQYLNDPKKRLAETDPEGELPEEQEGLNAGHCKTGI